ncbi:MAG: heme ABC transporter ATP-binding protein [Pseudomonadota bacterium]
MTLSLEKALVKRGGRAILDSVSLSCAPGQFTALCGPNGAGKTTALSALSGALSLSDGRALLDGAPVSSIPPGDLARRRAVVNQSPVLTFPFEVHEVVAMGRAPHRGRTNDVRDAEIIGAALEAVDIVHFAERIITTLSGGERQRAHIARALAQIWDAAQDANGAPLTRWLLLDEPTAALDLKHQLGLMRLLRRLADDGWGVVAVLHDLHMVRNHADTVILFQDGKIAAAGDAASVLTETSIQEVFDLNEPYAIG